jgi:hypothetical protein
MRSLKTALIALIVAWPLAASAADMSDYPQASRTVHHGYRHHYRHYGARTHYGYYFYHWGWRTGGTARSWYGSKFVFNDGYAWDGWLGW